MKNKIIIGVIALAVAVAGTGCTKLNGANNKKESDYQPLVVEQLDIESNVYVNGKVVTEEARKIQSEAVGNIEKVLVKPGDKVKKGDVLGTINMGKTEDAIKLKEIQLEIENAKMTQMRKSDNTLLLNGVKTAETQLEDAEKNYQSNLILYEAGSVSKNELEKVKKQVEANRQTYEDAKYSLKVSGEKTNAYVQMKAIESMEIEIEQMKNELKKAEIASGIDGTITEVIGKVGELSSKSNYLFVVKNFDKNVIKANISEAEISKIALGQSVAITGNAIKGRTLEGKVAWISPSSNKIEGKKQAYVEIKIAMDAVVPELRTDFSVSLKIQSASKKGAKCIKFEALNTERLGTPYVNLIDREGAVTKVPVKVGVEGDAYVEIISEKVNVGDQIMMNSEYDQVNQEDLGLF